MSGVSRDTGALTAVGVTVLRGGRAIVDGADADIRTGLVTAVVGPNGAGKSTLIRVLAGVNRPDAGSVEWDAHDGDGRDWLSMPRRERARIVALVEQDVTTELPLTVHMAVALGRTPHLSMFAAPSPHDDAIVQQAMEDAGIGMFADRHLDTLSGGERQRVHLARALAQEPRILFLDEPTNHLDVRAQLTTLALALSLAREGGLAIVAALHDLNLALAHADHVLVMHDGRVVAAGAPADVLTTELVDEVWRVRSSVLMNPRSGVPVIVFDLPDAGAAASGLRGESGARYPARGRRA